jgi:hypothetical protein
VNAPRTISVVVLLAAAANARLAAQGTPDEAPPPTSVDSLSTAVEAAGTALDTTQVELSDRERRSRRNMAVWILESRLTAQARGYSTASEHVDGSDHGATAAGGWIRFRSGRWRENYAFRAGLYTSMRLVGDTAKGGTGILAPDQGNLITVAVLNGEAYWHDQVLTVGRQGLNLPLVNSADSRMIPQTFTAATGRGPIALGWSWVGGYLWRAKPRDADRFVSMAQLAGAPAGTERGMLTAGVRRAEEGRFTAGLFDFLVPDVHNIVYAEASFLPLPSGFFHFKAAGQFLDQRTVGAGLLPGSPSRTSYVSGRLSVSRARVMLSLAASSVADGGDVVTSYGTFPGYATSMVTSFTRAGESALHAEASYDFSGLGAPGLTLFTGLTKGGEARVPATGQALPAISEMEITADYRPTTGNLAGFWFRARGARTWQAGAAPDGFEIRLIGYYDIPIPWPPRTSPTGGNR